MNVLKLEGNYAIKKYEHIIISAKKWLRDIGSTEWTSTEKKTCRYYYLMLLIVNFFLKAYDKQFVKSEVKSSLNANWHISQHLEALFKYSTPYIAAFLFATIIVYLFQWRFQLVGRCRLGRSKFYFSVWIPYKRIWSPYY